MSFMVHTIDDGRVPVTEYHACSAITPLAGMALVQSGGLLVAATGATKPTYISLCEREDACTEGEQIPVLRVQPDIVFETGFGADASAVSKGDKVTLSDDGMQVTATTTGGVAEVVGMDGTDAGDAVRVRFV